MTEPTARALREALSDANHAWRALDAHGACVHDLAWRMAGLMKRESLGELPTVRARAAQTKVEAIASALVTDAEILRDTLVAARRRLDELQYALQHHLANP